MGGNELMKVFVTVLVLILLALILASLVSMRISSIRSMEREKKDPCETCLRWEECNGVDEDCPLRWKDG